VTLVSGCAIADRVCHGGIPIYLITKDLCLEIAAGLYSTQMHPEHQDSAAVSRKNCSEDASRYRRCRPPGGSVAGESAQFDPWLTVQKSAERAELHPSSIRRATKTGRLRSVRVGGGRAIRIRASWVDEWLESGEVLAPATSAIRLAKGQGR